MEDSIGVASISLLHQPGDVLNDNIDVVVRLDDGLKYGITFFTPMNIATLLDRYQASGECLDGTFLWARGMIIVRDLNLATLDRSIRELVKSGEYKRAFEVLEDVD